MNMKKDVSIATLEEDILTVLIGKRLYGLQILSAVNEADKDVRQIGFGSLYPTLHRMQKKNLVESEWGDETDNNGARRKYYKVTGIGETMLNKCRDRRVYLSNWSPSPAMGVPI
jgi:PadR family transcriptional regulator, regulatory protein PadR